MPEIFLGSDRFAHDRSFFFARLSAAAGPCSVVRSVMYLEYTPSLAPVAKPGIHPKSGQKGVRRGKRDSGKKARASKKIEESETRSFALLGVLSLTMRMMRGIVISMRAERKTIRGTRKGTAG